MLRTSRPCAVTTSGARACRAPDRTARHEEVRVDHIRPPRAGACGARELERAESLPIRRESSTAIDLMRSRSSRACSTCATINGPRSGRTPVRGGNSQTIRIRTGEAYAPPVRSGPSLPSGGLPLPRTPTRGRSPRRRGSSTPADSSDARWSRRSRSCRAACDRRRSRHASPARRSAAERASQGPTCRAGRAPRPDRAETRDPTGRRTRHR